MTGSATSETPRWRKSTFSDQTNCVEIGELADGRIGIRSSRHPEHPLADFTRDEIVAFLRGVKAGEFDDLI